MPLNPQQEIATIWERTNNFQRSFLNKNEFRLVIHAADA